MLDIKKYRKLYASSPAGIAADRRYKKSLKGKECLRRYRQSIKGKIRYRINNAKYRRNKKKLNIEIVQSVYEDNIKLFGTLTCYLCLQPIPFGKDNLEHKIPFSRGGTNKKSNLGVACQQCNSKKYIKTDKEFIKLLIKKIKE